MIRNKQGYLRILFNAVLEAKIAFSTNEFFCKNDWISTCKKKKKKKNLDFILFTEIVSKWIIGLHVKHKTT